MDMPDDGSTSYPPVSDPWSFISQEDNTALANLSLPELQRRTREEIDRHRDYMLALSTIHNAAAPIHTLLPPEILINIFAVLPIEDLRDVRIMLVCRRWRDLLLRTPEFWANLLTVMRMGYHPMKDDFLATTLQRSYPQKLKLKINVKILQKPEFTPHFGRISSLRLDVIVGWYEQMHELLLSNHLPALESLAIELFTADGQKLSELCLRLHPCTDDHLPCLRHLNVPGEVFAYLFSVSQLRTLTLCRLEYLHGFDVSNYTAKLVGAIRQCTNLHTLRVESLPNSGWNEIVRHEAEANPFPNLRMLEIVLTHDHAPLANVLQHLVHHVAPPRGARIQLIAGRASSPVSILMPAHHLATQPEGEARVYVDVSGSSPLALTVFLDNVEFVEVKVAPPGQETETAAPEPSTTSLTRYMRFIMQYFTFIQSIDTLEFYYGLNRSITQEDLKLVLELLPFIKSLTLHGWLTSQPEGVDPGDRSDAPHDLLGALCDTSQPDGDIPCPSLRKLEFVCEGLLPEAKRFANRLAAVLSARQSMSATRLDLFTLRHSVQTAEGEARRLVDDVLEELTEVVLPLVDELKLVSEVEAAEDA